MRYQDGCEKSICTTFAYFCAKHYIYYVVKKMPNVITALMPEDEINGSLTNASSSLSRLIST